MARKGFEQMELKKCGIRDLLIACIDRLKGFRKPLRVCFRRRGFSFALCT